MTPSGDSNKALRVISLIVLLLVVGQTSVWAQAESDDSWRPFPATLEEALDATTLQLEILADQKVDRTSHPEGRLRVVTVRYFSHNWMDGPWHGTIEVALPDPMPADWGGQAVMVPTGSINTEDGVDLRRDNLEFLALEYGIPTATIPFAGEHLGLSQPHALADHLFSKYVETGEPAWLPVYPQAVLRSRAFTAIGQLAGRPVTHAIQMGSSLSAALGWLWAAWDPRAKGFVATGDISHARKTFPLDGTAASQRAGHIALARATPQLIELGLRHADLYTYGSELTCPVLQIVGTNDWASPLEAVPEFVTALGGPVHLVYNPNYPHGTGSRRHVDLLRMWVAHVFYGRELTRVSATAAVEDGRLTCRADVTGDAEVLSVDLVYTASEDPLFLRSRFLLGTPPEDHYVRAVWQRLPMSRTDTGWTASVALTDDLPSTLHCFVDVTDEVEGQRGYASSEMLHLTRQER